MEKVTFVDDNDLADDQLDKFAFSYVVHEVNDTDVNNPLCLCASESDAEEIRDALNAWRNKETTKDTNA